MEDVRSHQDYYRAAVKHEDAVSELKILQDQKEKKREKVLKLKAKLDEVALQESTKMRDLYALRQERNELSNLSDGLYSSLSTLNRWLGHDTKAPTAESLQEIVDDLRVSQKRLHHAIQETEEEMLELDQRIPVRELEAHKAAELLNHKFTYKPGGGESLRALTRVKEAYLTLARERNPKVTACAEALGRLLLRTPDFFLRHLKGGLTADAETVSHKFCPDTRSGEDYKKWYEEEEAELFEASKKVEKRFSRDSNDHEKLSLCKQMSEIDKLVLEAQCQKASSIKELLFILAQDNNLDIHCKEHLLRAVADVEHLVRQVDRDRMDTTDSGCALTAWWPPADEGYVPARGEYKPLLVCIEEACESAVARKRDDLKQKREVSMTSAKSMSSRMHSTATSARMSSQAAAMRVTEEIKPEEVYDRVKVDFGHNLSLVELVCRVKIGEANDDFIVTLAKRILEKWFDDALEQDPLMHITPTVLQLMLKSIEETTHKLKGLEMAIFGQGLRSADQEHWFNRCKAVADLGDMARHGSVEACRILGNKVVKLEASQWMVRQLAVAEVCKTLATMKRDDPRLDMMMEALAMIALVTRQEEEERKQGHGCDEATLQGIAYVQEEAVKVVVAEFPTFHPSVREKFRDELQHNADMKPHVRGPVFDRIMQKVSKLLPVKQQANEVSMRRMRRTELERKADYREEYFARNGAYP
eukprot:CAMPEP_0178412756 /NCGR_PEP_ID=MMETSP0689_2-20121128/22180_1 /TAXON_ID=160604 /ORGANISM="Amphidinium massartii, Strain CS-259" /LENGTH=700 /DNA_ID=CAMNT_0020034015 /DNA_START=3 /DNA_END=2102 /DNA_ORIENTATION=+